MLIYLFRHGIAIDRDDPECPEESSRYLTRKGRDRTMAAASGVRWLGLEPEVIYSSPWLRATQTAEIVRDQLNKHARVQTSDALLWEAKPSLLMEELRGTRSTDAFCVGHAPHLDLFIAFMVGANRPVTELKKAGLALLHADEVEPGRAVLLGVYPPRTLRRMAGKL